MAPSTNRQGHRPFKAAMHGSNPAGVTKYRADVMAAHLTLTQAVEVQILGPVPQGPLVKLDKTPASQAGGVGFKSHRGHQQCRDSAMEAWLTLDQQIEVRFLCPEPMLP